MSLLNKILLNLEGSSEVRIHRVEKSKLSLRELSENKYSAQSGPFERVTIITHPVRGTYSIDELNIFLKKIIPKIWAKPCIEEFATHSIYFHFGKLIFEERLGTYSEKININDSELLSEIREENESITKVIFLKRKIIVRLYPDRTIAQIMHDGLKPKFMGDDQVYPFENFPDWDSRRYLFHTSDVKTLEGHEQKHGMENMTTA